MPKGGHIPELFKEIPRWPDGTPKPEKLYNYTNKYHVPDPFSILEEQFNHFQNYEITKTKVITKIGVKNIHAWESELNDIMFKQNTKPNENPKDMFKYFPDAMNSLPFLELDEDWQKFYTNASNKPYFTDYVMKNTDGTETNYNDIVENGEFKVQPDISGPLITNFRNKFGIMVGNDTEAEEDRRLYVNSLRWTYTFHPENYLPAFNRENNRQYFLTNRYSNQAEYNHDKDVYEKYLRYQVDNKRMLESRYKELMNNWRKENKGTYLSSKYNPLKPNPSKSNPSNSNPSNSMGGRKTRKGRKSKKSKHSKKSKKSKHSKKSRRTRRRH